VVSNSARSREPSRTNLLFTPSCLWNSMNIVDIKVRFIQTCITSSNIRLITRRTGCRCRGCGFRATESTTPQVCFVFVRFTPEDSLPKNYLVSLVVALTWNRDFIDGLVLQIRTKGESEHSEKEQETVVRIERRVVRTACITCSRFGGGARQ
jgi:NMD protein affecting ribosome stability and mRNA decay